MGLAEELQDETAEVLSSADPLQDGQPARQRARVPGVARGLPGGRRARGRAGRRRAGAPEPGGDAARAATARALGYLSPRGHRAGRPEDWSADPWGAEIRDGFLYGRGAIDMKNQTAAEAVAAARLARAGAKFGGTLKVISRRRRGDRRRPRRQVDHREAARPLARRLPAQRGRGRGHAVRRPPPVRRLRGREGHVPLQRAHDRHRRPRLRARPGRQRAAQARPADHQARRGPARLRPDRGHPRAGSRRSARSAEDPERRAGARRARSRRRSRRCSTPR